MANLPRDHLVRGGPGDDHGRPRRTHHPPHRRRTDDGKGYRRLIAGGSSASPPASMPGGRTAVPAHRDPLAGQRAILPGFECELAWTEIAIWAAEYLRRGDLQSRSRRSLTSSRATGHPIGPTGSSTSSVVTLRENSPYPGRSTTSPGMRPRSSTRSSRITSPRSTGSSRNATPNRSLRSRAGRTGEHREAARITEQMPPDPSTPLVAGTLHEALRAYEEERRRDFTRPDGRSSTAAITCWASSGPSGSGPRTSRWPSSTSPAARPSWTPGGSAGEHQDGRPPCRRRPARTPSARSSGSSAGSI